MKLIINHDNCYFTCLFLYSRSSVVIFIANSSATVNYGAFGWGKTFSYYLLMINAFVRDIIQEYASKIVTLSEDILKAMARSLKLREDSFLKKQTENPSMFTKFIYYPPCSRPDRVLGARSHSDPSTLTILLPDEEVEGLDILKDDRWYKVPVMTGTIFINLGDVGEVSH